jgi:hypothetical protein
MLMNRLEITLETSEDTTPAACEVAWQNTCIVVPSPAARVPDARSGTAVELITRRIGAGTSVRRHRGYRSAWPRKN